MRACAVFEIYVHGHGLIGAVYMTLGTLMNGPSTQLPNDFVRQLGDLAAQADEAERSSAAEEFEAAISDLDIDMGLTSPLRQALVGTGGA